MTALQPVPEDLSSRARRGHPGGRPAAIRPPARPVLRALSRTTAALTALLLACGAPQRADAPTPAPADAPAPTPSASASEADSEARRVAELQHHVVFADRITYSYVLLLPGEKVPTPTRDELAAAVRKAFPGHVDDEEVSLLLGLISRPEPELGVPEPTPDPDAPDAGRRAADLFGLAIEAHALPPASGPPLIKARVLGDADLTRDLSPEERASLDARRSLLVLRAQYRNQHAVRGLRLLQTLVRVVATQRGALIHDPDTLETVGPAVFAARRLQTSLGNVADQIPVVPFPDPRHPGRFRLATRGMRRFGSVDLELGGLPGDLPVLQQATYFLHGLALVMIELGEFDASGFAAELPPIVTVHFSDCAGAYSGRPGSLPRCADCPESAEVHLVERAPEPQDAVSHVVARVIAPRSLSDQPAHDHSGWAVDALNRVLGRPASM